jgi:hypothetical protein
MDVGPARNTRPFTKRERRADYQVLFTNRDILIPACHSNFIRGRDLQSVVEGYGLKYRTKIVKPIGAPADHLQMQIDLREGR